MLVKKTPKSQLGLPNNALLRFFCSSHLEIDVSRMFGQHSHHVCEALVDGDVERRAHGVVQKVYICPFAQQQPCDLCLVTKVKHSTNGKRLRLLCCL